MEVLEVNVGFKATTFKEGGGQKLILEFLAADLSTRKILRGDIVP